MESPDWHEFIVVLRHGQLDLSGRGFGSIFAVAVSTPHLTSKQREKHNGCAIDNRAMRFFRCQRITGTRSDSFCSDNPNPPCTPKAQA